MTCYTLSVKSQARKNLFQLGADNTRILAKFNFELILLYEFAQKLGADQSVYVLPRLNLYVNLNGCVTYLNYWLV